MRNLRRLPPFLRVVYILGGLLFLAALVLCVAAFIVLRLAPPHTPVFTSLRLMAIALNLSLLGLACTAVALRYNRRVRWTDGRPFPLDWWQRQVLAILVLATLPICALAMTISIPPTSPAFQLVFPISALGSFVLTGACATTATGRQAAD
jgi:hypothetical protein